jgi:hypothetical protein
MTRSASPDAPTPALKIVELSPIESVDELDATGRAQLEKASKLYGGMELTAEQILNPGEDEDTEEEGRIDPGFLERGRIVDAGGKPLYDVLLYMVDSGTFFAHGTTDVVAEVIQMSVECSDKGLHQALSKALADRPKKQPRRGAQRSPLAAYEEAMAAALADQKKSKS